MTNRTRGKATLVQGAVSMVNIFCVYHATVWLGRGARFARNLARHGSFVVQSTGTG